MNRIRPKIYYVLVMSLCASCASMYGIKSQKDLSQQEVAAFADKHQIALSLRLDTTYYETVKMSELSEESKKNYLQPLQLWVYRGDSLMYGTVNCYAPAGLFNLKWHFNDPASQIDRNGRMGYEKHIKLLTGSSSFDSVSQSEYVAVVVWSEWMGRQNDRFLEQLGVYFQSNKISKVSYFNADSIYPEAIRN